MSQQHRRCCSVPFAVLCQSVNAAPRRLQGGRRGGAPLHGTVSTGYRRVTRGSEARGEPFPSPLAAPPTPSALPPIPPPSPASPCGPPGLSQFVCEQTAV
ncbi:hypothetical protein E2C01_016297 [Portunus trituberculatus]|uniref:Uncharacterized protein n=1 Tax=Portunus trituberculatus TaxID=210409 RepID=A0A5B7DQ72_PORTR|nr:hypothetical protein [Portunus trituberculatus]